MELMIDQNVSVVLLTKEPTQFEQQDEQVAILIVDCVAVAKLERRGAGPWRLALTNYAFLEEMVSDELLLYAHSLDHLD